jgi:hypothetical protein
MSDDETKANDPNELCDACHGEGGGFVESGNWLTCGACDGKSRPTDLSAPEGSLAMCPTWADTFTASHTGHVPQSPYERLERIEWRLIARCNTLPDDASQVERDVVYGALDDVHAVMASHPDAPQTMVGELADEAYTLADEPTIVRIAE